MSDKIGRRDLLGAAALISAAAAVGRPLLVDTARAATEANDGIVSASAAELAEAIRSKKWSSKEIVEAHLDRIAKVNPKLNAVVQLTAEAARKEADEADAALARGEIKGPLHGVPITIKDTLETTGVICTGGTKGRANFVPKADATAVARLRAAGAASSSARPMCPNSQARPRPTIWSMGGPIIPMILRARRAAAAAVRPRSLPPAVRRSASAPMPAAVSESLRIIAASPPSSRRQAACHAPDNSRCRSAHAIPFFMSA